MRTHDMINLLYGATLAGYVMPECAALLRKHYPLHNRSLKIVNR